tara:strand:+ start:161 stop:427 length:267 start_codon:yes stop_codon:yes gene_type:complete
MYKIVNEHDFLNEFKGGEQFTLDALKVLFEYYDYANYTLDIGDIKTTWNESEISEVLESYALEQIEHAEELTVLLYIPNSTRVLYQDF